MNGIRLSHIYKIYPNGVPAVKDFTMDIEDQEFIVLVGPSGCGKSTTLRMIAGLEKITDGELYIYDNLVNDVEPKDRDIAMVFQNYALYPHMTVFDNMAFGLKLKKVPKPEIKERVLNAARILGIEDYLDRKPAALSGGQRQRVAIGRAIVRDPRVFLFDEPLSNLDAKLRNQMRSEILLLRDRVKKTFIYVTHDQTEAMTLGDRIVIMKDGIVQQIGTPREVFNMPRNIFVAGFIGSPQMNFFDAKLETENTPKVVLGNVEVALADSVAAKLREAGASSCDITLGIRPEHITLDFEPKEDSFIGEFVVKESMGSEIYVHMKDVTGKPFTARIQTMMYKQEDLDKLVSGYKLGVKFYGEAMHFFDKEGKNLLVRDSE
ncbi:MAG: sn-glycerol-3-phosphate ABC transporter ATP-binding protein UgpC [Clostridiales bacterium]|nr:sn-glycerol-3-phosphate ABC transporter ATP-binding protein UgpC [Clostridiales bacterium]